MTDYEAATILNNPEPARSNYLYRVIEEDVEAGTYNRPVCTRFPPEPNAYLHIGNLYAININYTAAKLFGGKFNLRMDDTNPLKEKTEFVEAIISDMKWAGFDPGDNIFFGSDYFHEIFERTVFLIKKGLAYVCELTPDQMREYRGTLTTPGTNSPFRDRSVEENLRLFCDMRDGKYAPGAVTLRAKIDMASPNMNMRDPALYRVLNAEHYRTGGEWKIYPMYDYAHPIQDAIEGITHSMCSIEFKDHRPLYEWVLESLEFPEPPKQREFGRVNITGAITSKRYIRQLVELGYVDGWDDPRLPTVQGMRRRGITKEAIQNFLNETGLSRNMSTVSFSMLEHFLREDLKPKAPTVMAVLRPLKVTITNYPEGETEYVEVENNAENPDMGTRKLPFSRHLVVEREDFMEIPEKGFRRLFAGNEVRLKGAYFIRCEGFVKDENGEVTEVLCTYDPATKSGLNFTERKVKATLHWLDANDNLPVSAALYGPLLKDNSVGLSGDVDWEAIIDKSSKTELDGSLIERSVENALPEDKFQFIRHGYFVLDRHWKHGETMRFNLIAALKDSKGKGN